MIQQNDDARNAILSTLAELVEQRKQYAAGLSAPPLNLPKSKHAEMGRDVLQGRLSQLLATTDAENPDLDIGEAFDAFVVALAHFAVADGRSWRVTSVRLFTAIPGAQLELANERNEP